MALVEFCDVSYEIGGKTILSGVNLAIETGETLVLLGRSGSGKTTALKMTNGMTSPPRGDALVEGRLTTKGPPLRHTRRIGYVIREVVLSPHWTVGANVALPPKPDGPAPAEIAQRVERLMNSVGLAPAEF